MVKVSTKTRAASRPLVVCTLIPFLIGADAPRKLLSLDNVMSREDQAATGVAKLSPEERAALELWLTRFAAAVVIEVKKKADGAQKAGLYAGIGQKHWMKEKTDGGAFVKLEDGSLWEISPIDKINTMLWLPIDNVTVIESNNPLYPYKLVGEKDSAEAKLVAK